MTGVSAGAIMPATNALLNMRHAARRARHDIRLKQ